MKAEPQSRSDHSSRVLIEIKKNGSRHFSTQVSKSALCHPRSHRNGVSRFRCFLLQNLALFLFRFLSTRHLWPRFLETTGSLARTKERGAYLHRKPSTCGGLFGRLYMFVCLRCPQALLRQYFPSCTSFDLIVPRL